MSLQINLYRPIFRKQEKKFSAKAMVQAGVFMLAGIVVLYAVFAWQVRSLRDESAKIDRQYTDAVARLENITQRFGPRDPSQALIDRAAALERQVEIRRRVYDALRGQVFTNVAGYSDYFLAFARQDLPEVWLTAFTITGAGEDVTLRGRTTDPVQVPRYVQRLSAENAMADKAFQLFFLQRGKGRYAEFQFSTKPAATDEGPGS